ncbi:hypothetical protein ABS767_12200 [Sphingomonas sp. ST-64]|uniref:Uncharacterized protein n=1 Tax=Sphingomonas plantiphila TaxID=3163295 RepID=A0ABW8YRM1_9SPHN
MASSEVRLLPNAYIGDSPELPFAELLPTVSRFGINPLHRVWHASFPVLGKHVALDPIVYNRKAHGPRLTVVGTSETIQYPLPLEYRRIDGLSDEVAQLKDYLPRSRLALMQHSFWSIIVREPGLRRLANELHEMGKPLVGDVVQMTPEELARDAYASPREIALLQGVLANADLALGTKIANWSATRQTRGR